MWRHYDKSNISLEVVAMISWLITSTWLWLIDPLQPRDYGIAIVNQIRYQKYVKLVQSGGFFVRLWTPSRHPIALLLGCFCSYCGGNGRCFDRECMAPYIGLPLTCTDRPRIVNFAERLLIFEIPWHHLDAKYSATTILASVLLTRYTDQIS